MIADKIAAIRRLFSSNRTFEMNTSAVACQTDSDERLLTPFIRYQRDA
jgi:hypothetical protein